MEIVVKQENKIEVSIICYVYNHIKFIKKTLDGFLMQNTNFNYEIIIHDDASTDGTIDILKEYKKRYPKKIRLILEEENMYSKTNDFSVITRMMYSSIRGKYIAECEGDDQWIDDRKLQCQYDFMELHENTLLCLHNGLLNNVENGKQEKMVKGLNTGYLSAEETIFIPHGFFPTSSFFYRAEVLEKFPEWYYQLPVGDDPLRYICMNYGNIYYIDEVWSMYNYMHEESWNQRMKDSKLKMEYLDGYLYFLRIFDEYSNGKFSTILNQLMESVCEQKVSLALPLKYNQMELISIIEKIKVAMENKFDEHLDKVYWERKKFCVDYMEEDVRNFIEQCNTCDGELYLYGTGEMAEIFSTVLENFKIKYHGYIVSNGHRKFKQYKNHPVYELLEISEKEKKVFIWLCLNKENTMQVLPKINALGFKNILYASYRPKMMWTYYKSEHI